MESIIYKKVGKLNISGDYYPTTKKNAPLILFIHGGGLIWGSSHDMKKEQIEFYLNNGFNVYAINYRLAPETKLPDIVKDIEDCLFWVYNQSPDTIDFDRNKIAVIGSSAGGYLALSTGTFKSIRPKAIVSFYGYGTVLGSWYTQPSRHFNTMTKVPEQLIEQLIQKESIDHAPIETRYGIYLYCRQKGKWLDYVAGLDPIMYGDRLKPFCPIENIDKNFPATLLLHGDADKDVPYEESVQMNEALQSKGNLSELITIKGGEHTFDYDNEKEVVKKAFNEVISFLNKNI